MQQITRLAVEHLAEPRQRREADRARVVVLEDREVRVGHADALRELGERHLALEQQAVDADLDAVRLLAHTVWRSRSCSSNPRLKIPASTRTSTPGSSCTGVKVREASAVGAMPEPASAAAAARKRTTARAGMASRSSAPSARRRA